MASSMHSTCPFLTDSPTFTLTDNIVPGIGDTTVAAPAGTAAGAAALGAGAAGAAAGAALGAGAGAAFGAAGAAAGAPSLTSSTYTS